MHETQELETIPRGPAFNDSQYSERRLGIIGGGQLARLTAISALQLGCRVAVLERDRFCPAESVAAESLVGDWNTLDPLLRLAERSDVITLENEFVDASLLFELERRGHLVRPAPSSIAFVQDKFIQKQILRAAGLPAPRTREVACASECADAVKEFGLPLMLKARRNAYDGKGNVKIRSESEAGDAWTRLGGADGRPLYAEEFRDFSRELAVIVTRGPQGAMAAYPVVETVQRNHVCHIVRAPAAVDPDIAARAAEIARRAVEAVGGIGSFGVEMFLARDGGIEVNELAPRVHNSGHYTIEACVCSQFENHVRAVLGLPLGSTRMVAPAAVMVNLLGATHAPARIGGLHRALAVAGARVHVYGKAMSGPGRKMGHVTALGETLAEAERAATRCAAEIRFESLG